MQPNYHHKQANIIGFWKVPFAGVTFVETHPPRGALGGVPKNWIPGQNPE